MVTLTGTFTRLDGDPATGTVKITPSRSPIMDPDGKIVISGPQVFPLDKDGKLTTEIPASNDPDLGPPFTYTVEALLSHKPWKISKVWIPHGPSTIDISTIADYTPLPGEPTRTVTVPADGEDGQVLVWDGGGFAWDYNPGGMPGPRGPQGPAIDIDTGIPISVDTAIGTRVFIGGHMVHGDTGWRTLTSWDSAGTITGSPLPTGIVPAGAGSISIKRENTTVTLTLRGLTITTNTSLALPNGFGASSPYGRSLFSNSPTQVGIASPGAYSVALSVPGSVSAHATFGLTLQFTSAGAWPTTLPGLPG